MPATAFNIAYVKARKRGFLKRPAAYIAKDIVSLIAFPNMQRL